ncbi:hypothetical protein EV401DRAFT_2005481 [Pisolithus croceorrhizus]|nr:hypothetical protein EV401DRAFT_2005481 [Pisolithus croceorrhizus]
MMVWLEDMPPILEVGYKPCLRCRSLLKSRYDDIAVKYTATPDVSLLDAFYNYLADNYYEDDVTFSRRLNPTAKLLVDRMLEPLMKKHGLDIRYLLSVNRYPQHLRPRVAKLLCGSYSSYEDGLPTVQLPDDVFNGAHDPWVVLGIIALATYNAATEKGTDSHDEDLHSYFSSFLHSSLQCFDMPVLPLLSSASLTLCHTIDQDYSEERWFDGFSHTTDDSNWVTPGQDGRQLRLSTAVMVAVIVFLRKKDVELYNCHRCQVVCTDFFTGTPSVVAFEVEDSSGHGGLGPPSVPVCGEDDVLGGGLSSPLELGIQEPAGMEAFTSILHNPTLSKDEIHLRLAGELSRLRQYSYSFGLGISSCLQRVDSSNEPCLGESTLPRHLPARGVSGSSKLSKSDRVEEIKDKLLDMLSKLAAIDCSSPSV